MNYTRIFFVGLIISAFSLLILAAPPSSARTWSDEEVEISWLSPSKPKFGKCTYGLVSITPRRDFMGMGVEVKNSRNKVIGWHGRVLVNLPINQKTNKVLTFCNFENRDFKGPYKLSVWVRYNPYRAPDSGETRTVEIPFKFLKNKKS
jgi:hypothetical protein